MESTAGPQPWRKVFHAVNSLIIALALTWIPSRSVALTGLAAIAAALLSVDVARLLIPRANELFFRAFRRLVSPREARGIASSTWYMLGVLAAVVLFPRGAAVSGILVLGFGDPIAGYIGRRFGTRPFLGGTLEGSLAFLATSCLILGLRHPLIPAFLVASLAMLVERRSWPIDDNFTIPVVTAGAVAWIGAVL